MLHAASLAVLALAVAIAQHQGAHAAVWHVPFERHTGGRVPLESVADAHRRLANTKTKASVWTPDLLRMDELPDGRSTTQRGVVPVDFRDIHLNLFAAKISIGTPPQPVSMVLDMGSSDLVVLNHAVGHHLYYDHTKSTTYEANGTQVKLDEGQPYEVDGFVSKDHITLSSADGASRVEVRDQLFMELTGPDKMIGMFPWKMDGSIGIGPGRANSTGAASIVRAMVDQNLLDRPVVGLSFGDVITHTVFGGVDPAYNLDDFHFIRQQQTDHWSVPISAVEVNGKQVLGDVGRALISNVDLVFGPADEVDALADAVGAENYALPCDGPGPNIIFQLGDGFQATLTKKDYAIPQDQGWCMFAIFPSPNPQWLLGLPVLHNVYTVLDFGASESTQRIGFAPVKP